MKVDDQQIINLLKFFNIQIPRGNGQLIDQAEIKKADFLN